MQEEYNNLKHKKLVLFFSYRVSLELWEKRGMLERELKLYRELGKYFNKIYFLTYGCNDSKFVEELRKYNIEVLPRRKYIPNILHSAFCILQYHGFLKRCDYFKTNQVSGSWSAVLAKWFYKKQLIVRMGFPLSLNTKKEGLIKYVFAKLAERLAFKNADKIVVATEYERDHFKKYAEKINIIPNFVDTDIFCPGPELKNKSDEKTILYIGRLSAEKNLNNLISAIGGIEDLKLKIIGSGPLQGDLQSLAREKRVKVEFLGNIDHSKLPDFINKANILVLSSLYEGNPKVLLEAMSCGAVVLGTDVRGINNIIQHKSNGFLAGTSVQELRAGIKDALLNQHLWSSVGLAARNLILEKYSFAKIFEKELQNYL